MTHETSAPAGVRSSSQNRSILLRLFLSKYQILIVTRNTLKPLVSGGRESTTNPYNACAKTAVLDFRNAEPLFDWLELVS
jgi:hypothetical protein